jgi:predicted DNA-binding transcriptional regulator YafY
MTPPVINTKCRNECWDAELMRAGRLLRLFLLLQDGRRHTAAELAERLEVSHRTALRDLETLSGSGVAVVA